MAPSGGSGGGELGAGVGAPFGLQAEGSRCFCFAGGAVGEASGSGRGMVRGGGFVSFRVCWAGRVGLGCVVSGELRARGQREVLAARHVRSSPGSVLGR